MSQKDSPRNNGNKISSHPSKILKIKLQAPPPSINENNDRSPKIETGIARGEVQYGEGSQNEDFIRVVAKPVKGQRPIPATAMCFLEMQQGEDARGIYTLVQNAELLVPEITELRRKRKAIDEQLAPLLISHGVEANKVTEAKRVFQEERIAAGISAHLWGIYEEFCACTFLQPDATEESIVLDFPYIEAFHDTYIKYDPHLKHFKERVTTDKGMNWRCNRIVTYPRGGLPLSYHVEFQMLPPKLPDWAERFADLYIFSLAAARRSSTAALEMLTALPYANGCCLSGHLFEFAYEEPHSSALIHTSRWSFRTAYCLKPPPGAPSCFTSGEKQAYLVRKYSLPFKVISEPKRTSEPADDRSPL